MKSRDSLHRALPEEGQTEYQFKQGGAFGLTLEKITDLIEAQRERSASFGSMSSDSSLSLAARAVGRRNLSEAAATAHFFDLMSPEEVLHALQEIYGQVINLAQTTRSQSDADIARAVQATFPVVMNYYPILRETLWGYHLGQELMVIQMQTELDSYDQASKAA